MTEPRTIDRYFVCIGAQKAGTTWLARALSRHPDIFMTPVKEIHYFDHIRGVTAHLSDAKRRSRYRKYHQRMWTQWNRWSEYRAQGSWYRAYMKDPIDDSWYCSLFQDRLGRKMAGEATPEYSVLGREGLEHIKRLAPDARVLYIMRDPVTRAWSQILHRCRVQNIDAGKVGDDRLISLTEPEDFRMHGDYGRVLDDLFAVFPPEQVLTAFYEEIHDDRLAALSRICDFLGVASFDDKESGLKKRYNRSQSVTMPDGVARHLRSLYAPVVRQVEERLGAVPEGWTRTLAEV